MGKTSNFIENLNCGNFGQFLKIWSISGGITREQHDKLKAQQKQYYDAKEKLEAQLLKLKEQRETLKEDGAVHDDQIMKENAKLQVSLFFPISFQPEQFINSVIMFKYLLT